MGQTTACSSNEGGRSVFRLVTFFFALTVAGSCKCAKPGEQREADLARLPRATGSLQDQLAAEAAARTSGTPTLEAVMSASGVTFNAPRQVLGQKQLATYCAAADSMSGMIVTVCEYPDPEQAARGEAEAKLVGDKLAGFQSRRLRRSVLQVVARSDTPPEQVSKVLGAFEAL